MKQAKKRLNYFKENNLCMKISNDIIYKRMSKFQQETNDLITKMFMDYYYLYKEKRDAIESAP